MNDLPADPRKYPPRSPYEKIGNVVFLARLYDQVRAKLAGTNGDYDVDAGRTKYFLDQIRWTLAHFMETVPTVTRPSTRTRICI